MSNVIKFYATAFVNLIKKGTLRLMSVLTAVVVYKGFGFTAKQKIKC